MLTEGSFFGEVWGVAGRLHLYFAVK
jgi:hypothetical protein